MSSGWPAGSRSPDPYDEVFSQSRRRTVLPVLPSSKSDRDRLRSPPTGCLPTGRALSTGRAPPTGRSPPTGRFPPTGRSPPTGLFPPTGRPQPNDYAENHRDTVIQHRLDINSSTLQTDLTDGEEIAGARYGDRDAATNIRGRHDDSGDPNWSIRHGLPHALSNRATNSRWEDPQFSRRPESFLSYPSRDRSGRALQSNNHPRKDLPNRSNLSHHGDKEPRRRSPHSHNYEQGHFKHISESRKRMYPDDYDSWKSEDQKPDWGRVRRVRWNREGDATFACGGKFFKPRNPQEELKDTWCNVCKRHLQDVNAMSAHERSKKHRQAVERARACEERDAEENATQKINVETILNHHQETNVATEEKLEALLAAGAHKDIPSSFRDWANRSLFAAKATGDPNLYRAVSQEILEELLMQKERSTIFLQNWAARENATGLLFLGGKATNLTIPLIEPSRKPENMRCNAVDDKFNEIALHNLIQPIPDPSTKEHGYALTALSANVQTYGHGHYSDARAVQWFPTATEKPTKRSADQTSGTGDVTPIDPSGLKGVIARGHTVDETSKISDCVGSDLQFNTVCRKSIVSRSMDRNDLCKDQAGFREAPVPPRADSIPARRRNTLYQPSSVARKIFGPLCVVTDSILHETVALLYERDYKIPNDRLSVPSRNPVIREGTDYSGVSTSNLRDELDKLQHEFQQGYNYVLFSAKVRAVIDDLEARQKPVSDTLRRAYELQIDCALPMDKFGDTVDYAERLMEIYIALRDFRIPRRDEFTAYYILSSLMTSSRASGALSKHVDRTHHSLPGILEKSARVGPLGPITRLALRILTSMLIGDWAGFFKIYNDEVRSVTAHGNLEIFMDGLTDFVRSTAVHALFYSVDVPRTYPLQRLMFDLNWYSAGMDGGEEEFQVAESRQFISKLGCKLLCVDDNPLQDGSGEYLQCSDGAEGPSFRLQTVFGPVSVDMLFQPSPKNMAR